MTETSCAARSAFPQFRRTDELGMLIAQYYHFHDIAVRIRLQSLSRPWRRR
ncbi:MAG: hypothetical protein ACLT4C_07265 [Butyricicoccus sp.]